MRCEWCKARRKGSILASEMEKFFWKASLSCSDTVTPLVPEMRFAKVHCATLLRHQNNFVDAWKRKQDTEHGSLCRLVDPGRKLAADIFISRERWYYWPRIHVCDCRLWFCWGRGGGNTPWLHLKAEFILVQTSLAKQLGVKQPRYQKFRIVLRVHFKPNQPELLHPKTPGCFAEFSRESRSGCGAHGWCILSSLYWFSFVFVDLSVGELTNEEKKFCSGFDRTTLLSAVGSWMLNPQQRCAADCLGGISDPHRVCRT